MAAPTLTWHIGPDGDRRTDPLELEDHAQESITYATGQDTAVTGRWVLVRFDKYKSGRINPVRLAETLTLAECRSLAQSDLEAL